MNSKPSFGENHISKTTHNSSNHVESKPQNNHASIPILTPETIVSHSDQLLTPKLEAYQYLRVTAEDNRPPVQPTVIIGGGAFATRGNISVISAAAKAGKTAFSNVVLAGAISADGNIDGFPELQVVPNQDGKAVIQFDTEQSQEDLQYNLQTVLKRAGIDKTPEYFRSYNIRQLEIDQYRKVTDEICEAANVAFGGIHLIMIDGGADYILSVNDEERATEIIQYFTHLSIKYDCPVIVIIHQNPGSQKERGHLGSQAQRKCYGLIRIERTGDISSVKSEMMRKASTGDMPLINFRYCKTTGYHVSVDPPDPEKNRAENDRKRHEAIAKAVFKPGVALNYKEAVSAIMKESSKKERTAKEMIKNMIGWELITKSEDGRHRGIL